MLQFTQKAYIFTIGLALSGLMLSGCQGGGNNDQQTKEKGPATQQKQNQQQQNARQQRRGQGNRQRGQGNRQMMQQGPKAAENVSDEELKKFAKAVQNVQKVQQESQTKMKETLDKEGMKAKRFNEIMKKKRSKSQEASMTDKEKEQYNKINKKLQKIRAQSQPKMQSAIKESGLTMKRYQAIMKAVQQDRELQKKMQKYMPKQPGMQRQQQSQSTNSK